MAEELDLDELRAHALNNIGVARKTIGDWGGVADLERSLAIALEINSPESVRAYLNLGSHSAILGDLRRAFDLYAQGRAAAERLGDAQGRRWFSVERVFEDYWSGRWEEASRLADELLVEVEAGSELGCRFVRGWIRLARDNLAEALEDAGKALDFAREVKHPQALLPALALQARGLLAAGQTQQVAELAGELLETWAESGVALASFWTADLAGVMTALGHGAELLDTAARIETPTRWLEAAKAFAGEDFQRAAETYAEIGTLPDEAFARLRAGESLIAAGRREEADSELARALAFYRHVGADAYVREGEALLAASA